MRNEEAPTRPVTVCLDLTDTRAALIDGVVDMVISHPRTVLTEATVAAMVRALEDKANDRPTQILLPFDIFIAENV